jgi:ketosteroid isomerase-like protein
MSDDDVEPVRQPISVSASSHRHLDERLGLRFPAALARFAALIWRLPPRSRLRRALSRRAVKLGIEAYNRGYLDAALAWYHPDVEYITPRQIIPLGFDPIYRGRQGRIEVQQRWTEEWGEFEFRPEELIDLGDGRLLQVGRMRGRGASSGAALDNDYADLQWLSGGRVIREQVFLDRAEALDAAGLSE